jgi:GT2 family glycosyltransferase
MISLILPYWDRQAAADRALATLAAAYRGMDGLEVIVVDDGTPRPFIVPPTGLRVRVLRLEKKDYPRSPIRAWNEGVKFAWGDRIALSCVEVLHPQPVLAHLDEEAGRLGPMGYALAAAWCPEQDRWHCHSSVPVPDCPPGAGLSFCGVMSRALFDMAGGFDERYLGGAGYEDRDFIRTLFALGARFSIRDDLVVHHPKTGASIRWGEAALERNRRIYESKWTSPS